MSIEKQVVEVKEFFEHKLREKLGLQKVYAPLFLPKDTGLNDGLSGSEKAVSFTAKDIEGELEVVHSLAKWKRYYLGKNPLVKGIVTDMKAIRKDEALSPIHSILVDQWDWELRIEKHQRNTYFLKLMVQWIYEYLYYTQQYIHEKYPIQFEPNHLWTTLPSEIFIITTQELEDKYPSLSPKEREDRICKEKGAVFLTQIGYTLNSGIKHGERAFDYDDWMLNGDILVWHSRLGQAFELSSMGIRVDDGSLIQQAKITGSEERLKYPYHQAILDGTLPLTIGGGIGQSRIAMYMLQCTHIGQVQASVWPQQIVDQCREKSISLL